MATHSVFLPGESHGQRSLEGYSPWGCQEMRAGQLKRCLNAHRDTQANICQGSSPALAGLDSSPYQQETMASTGGAITALGITSS